LVQRDGPADPRTVSASRRSRASRKKSRVRTQRWCPRSRRRVSGQDRAKPPNVRSPGSDLSCYSSRLTDACDRCPFGTGHSAALSSTGTQGTRSNGGNRDMERVAPSAVAWSMPEPVRIGQPSLEASSSERRLAVGITYHLRADKVVPTAGDKSDPRTETLRRRASREPWSSAGHKYVGRLNGISSASPEP
jgi:hypothetical protein